MDVALQASAARGIDPATSNQNLAEDGTAQMQLALRGLEPKTTDPYLAGWRLRVVPALGHLSLTMVTNGAVDRATYAWIADGEGRSTVKNSLAVLVRVMEQAVRDGLITANPARIKGWQRQYRLAEDELDDPRALALRDWAALEELAAALVARSHGEFTRWGEVVLLAACTAARIGEVSGVRVKDIDTTHWIWTVRRQTTPSPGGLADKNTKGKVARSLGYEHLRRHDLRHTGLTWMADAGVPVHVLRLIAGHGSLQTTQRYLHPDLQSVVRAGHTLSGRLNPIPTPPATPLSRLRGL